MSITLQRVGLWWTCRGDCTPRFRRCASIPRPPTLNPRRPTGVGQTAGREALSSSPSDAPRVGRSCFHRRDRCHRHPDCAVDFAAAGGLLLCFAASRITGSAITSTPPSAMTEIVDAHYATESWVSAASLADPGTGRPGFVPSPRLPRSANRVVSEGYPSPSRSWWQGTPVRRGHGVGVWPVS